MWRPNTRNGARWCARPTSRCRSEGGPFIARGENLDLVAPLSQQRTKRPNADPNCLDRTRPALTAILHCARGHIRLTPAPAIVLGSFQLGRRRAPVILNKPNAATAKSGDDPERKKNVS